MNISKAATFLGHKDCVYSLCKSPVLASFLSVSGDGMVVLWDINDPENGQLAARVPNSIYSIALIENLNSVVVGQNFEGIHLIDLASKKEVFSVKCTDTYIFDIKVFANKIYVACGNGTLVVIDLNKKEILNSVSISTKSLRSIAIHPLAKEIIVGSSDHSVRVLDLDTLTPKISLNAHTNSVFSVSYSPDFSTIYSTGRDATFKIWESEPEYHLISSIPAHMYAINHLCFAPNGKHIATASMDKTLKIWDAVSNKLLKVVDKSRYVGHGSSINKLLWLNENQLVSCSDDRSISLWQLEDL